MNVYEIQFRERGFMAPLVNYRPVTETLEAAITVAHDLGKQGYVDIFARGDVEMVYAKEIVRDVVMPKKQRRLKAA